MLFQSSIRKELARNFGASLVVLITIVMTIALIRTLGQASRGFVNPQDVMLFMAYSALGRLPTILSLALFMAMVNTLSRMYRDSEMVVWFTSGLGLAQFLRPLFRFSWPILLIISFMALFAWPWSNAQVKEMQRHYEQRGDLDRITPGQFQESSSGNRVFFIDRQLVGQKVSNNVFIAATEKGKSSITTARSGKIKVEGDQQFLMLENGQRLENEVGKSALKVSDFAEYGTVVGNSGALGALVPEAKLLPTRSLIKVPTLSNQGELAWRLGLVISAFNFVLLAVALASVNPRGGRSGNTIFVLLAFVVYNNLVNLGQSWIFVGLVSFPVLLIALHGGIFALGALWLAKRHYNWVLRPAARLKPTTAASNQGAATP